MTETKNEKSTITLGLIISWSLGVLFVLAGIGGLFQAEAKGMGIACLIIACLLLPPIRRLTYQKTGKTLSTGVRFVLLFVFLICGATTMPKSELAIDSMNVSQDEPSQEAVVTDKSSKELVVEDFSLQMDAYGTGKIVGTLKNNTNKEHAYAQVEFNLYDDNGAQVGSTLANINNLEPGGTWSFEAPVLEGRATQAKLKGITAF